jgi:hypothetical protein
MVDGLKTGDRVVTNSGIIGTIANVKDSRFIVKISDDTKIEIFKSYIQAKLDKEKADGDGDESEEGGRKIERSDREESRSGRADRRRWKPEKKQHGKTADQ